jgi:hypothetical protein
LAEENPWHVEVCRCPQVSSEGRSPCARNGCYSGSRTVRESGTSGCNEVHDLEVEEWSSDSKLDCSSFAQHVLQTSMTHEVIHPLHLELDTAD